MAWGKLSSVDGAGTGTNITTGTIAKNTFIEFNIYATAFVDGKMLFNGGGGGNYSRRYSGNGGTDGTGEVNMTSGFEFLSGLAPAFIHGFTLNISTGDKLTMAWSSEGQSTGVANRPNRLKCVGKWANTTVQIEKIDLNKSSTNFTSDENLTVLGDETTPSQEVVQKVQDGAIFYETDTNKSYILYNASWSEL